MQIIAGALMAKQTYIYRRGMALIQQHAQMGGRKVVAHASTAAGMRWQRWPVFLQLSMEMVERCDFSIDEAKKRSLVPYHWQPLMPLFNTMDGRKDLIRSRPDYRQRKSFQSALKQGVTIVFGGDVGVFTHGDNAREMELMVEYGMKPIDVLRSATSVNADVFGYAEQYRKN